MKIVKYSLYGAVTIFLSIGLTSGVASAHVLKEDNGISAVLHIPPEDNPKANQPTDLNLFFGNKQNTFSLQDCTCNVKVQSTGNTIQTVGLQASKKGDSVDGVGVVNFPTVGIYDVIVEGSSKDGKFNSFKLDYLERVAASANATNESTQNNGSQVIIIGTFSFLLLIMTAYTLISRGSRYGSDP